MPTLMIAMMSVLAFFGGIFLVQFVRKQRRQARLREFEQRPHVIMTLNNGVWLVVMKDHFMEEWRKRRSAAEMVFIVHTFMIFTRSRGDDWRYETGTLEDMRQLLEGCVVECVLPCDLFVPFSSSAWGRYSDQMDNFGPALSLDQAYKLVHKKSMVELKRPLPETVVRNGFCWPFTPASAA